MLFQNIDSNLFRPLASPNAKLYAVGLSALYERMIKNQLEATECTPRMAKDIIARELINISQFGSDIWQKEDDLLLAAGEDDATRIYNRLRDCGWLREWARVGYHTIVYIPHDPAAILTAFSRLADKEGIEIGAVCHGVLDALKSIIKNPKANARSLAFAAKNARDFRRELNGIASSILDIQYKMYTNPSNRSRLELFFKDYFKEVLLRDFFSINVNDNPYQFRGAINRAVADIQMDRRVMNSLVESVALNLEIDPCKAEEEVKKNLFDISQVFENIHQLMERILEYNSDMLRRGADSAKYTRSVPNNLGEIIDSVIKAIHKSGETEFPNPSCTQRYISPELLYKPKKKRAPPEPTVQQRSSVPLREIAYQRAQNDYLLRRMVDPERIYLFMKNQLGARPRINTNDMVINTLDELIAFLQLRDLINDSPSPDTELYPLLQFFHVQELPEEVPNNEFLDAPVLEIRRRVPELPETYDVD